MVNGHYILDGYTVRRVKSLHEWGKWMEEGGNRIVAKTVVGSSTISTVFLGLDHGYGRIPLFFETMVFGGLNDGYQIRYTTHPEAVGGHEQVVQAVKAGKKLEED